MTPEYFAELPRFYTAVAEWMTCILFVLILPRKYSMKKTVPALILGFVTMAWFHEFAGTLPLFFWPLTMLVAVVMMYLTISRLTEQPKKNAAYFTIRAFLMAEFMASLEWQIHSYFARGVSPLVDFAFMSGLYLALFGVFYLFERRVIHNENLPYISTSNLLITIGIGVFAFFLSNVSYLEVGSPFTMESPQEIFIMRTLSDFGGLAFLYVQHVQITNSNAQKELEIVRRTLHDQYNQYKLSKSNMEMIQLKYHDIKNQISVIRAEIDPVLQEKYLQDLESEMQSYQFQYETGNNVLDILMTQKGLVCQDKNIEITCVVDGKLLNFMKPMDISTIFGNALDNAIEYEEKISDPQKRLIQVSVHEKNKFAFIKIENYAEGVLPNHKNEQWETTKKNKKDHGFGLKSIRYCVSKYQGNVLLEQNGHWVQLKILIPIPKQI